jgi:hypothetical protein
LRTTAVGPALEGCGDTIGEITPHRQDCAVGAITPLDPWLRVRQPPGVLVVVGVDVAMTRRRRALGLWGGGVRGVSLVAMKVIVLVIVAVA